jgi:hypothetical protein
VKSKHVRHNYTGNKYGILKLRVRGRCRFFKIEFGARSKNEVVQIAVAGAALIAAVKISRQPEILQNLHAPSILTASGKMPYMGRENNCFYKKH